MGSVQRGQLKRKRSALQCEKVFNDPTEDRDGCLLGWKHGTAGLRFQDQGQLLRQILRLLPWQLHHNGRSSKCQNWFKLLFICPSSTKHLANKFNHVLLQMNRKFTISNVLLDKDTFVVTVFPHVDYVFIATLVVILDEVHREKYDG
jgi:hypothetical protein